MRVVDGKAIFPLWVIEASVPTDDTNSQQFLKDEGFVNSKRDIYDEAESNFLSSLLTKEGISYTITDSPSIDKKDAETLIFKSRDELIKYLNEGVAPSKTIQELEEQVKSTEDALLTLMFTGVT